MLKKHGRTSTGGCPLAWRSGGLDLLQDDPNQGRASRMRPDQDIANLLRFIVRSDPLDSSQLSTASTGDVRSRTAFLDLATRHRLIPLCHAVLTRFGAGLPSATKLALEALHNQQTLLNLGRAVELLQVLDAFSEAKIEVIPFKGVALAALLYGDFTLRAAGDLDLILHRKDLRQATEIILARGYTLATPIRPDGRPVAENYDEYHFERRSDGMILELRWRLDFVHPRYAQDIGLDWMAQRKQFVQLAGAQVPVPDAEATLILLCMHACKHRWSRLNWVCDVAQLLRVTPSLDWAKVQRDADKVGLCKAVALGLLLAHRVAGVDIPLQVVRDLDSFPSVKCLADYLEYGIFYTPGQVPQGLIPYHIRLLDRQDLLRLAFSMHVLKPTQRDQELFPLPPSLRWIHAIIRPFRLLLDRSAR